MKNIAIIIISILSVIACKTDIDPTSIVGKWENTYIFQRKDSTGIWSKWKATSNPGFGFTTNKLYQFTGDGRFFREGKPGVLSCRSGNRYAVSNNKITFSERDPIEARVNCIDCSNWEIVEIKDDTLILQECTWTRNKFVRIR